MEPTIYFIFIFLFIGFVAVYTIALSTAVNAIVTLMDSEASASQVKRSRKRLSSFGTGTLLGFCHPRLLALVAQKEVSLLAKEATNGTRDVQKSLKNESK